MKNELKPCPFCGREAYLDVFEYRGSVYEAVFCDECGIKGKGYPYEACDDKKLAIEAWNNRKPIEQIVKHLKCAEKREYENACNRRNNNYEQSNGYVKGIRDAIDIVRNGYLLQ
jgi:restriction alleviation protein, lar family